MGKKSGRRRKAGERRFSSPAPSASPLWGGHGRRNGNRATPQRSVQTSRPAAAPPCGSCRSKRAARKPARGGRATGSRPRRDPPAAKMLSVDRAAFDSSCVLHLRRRPARSLGWKIGVSPQPTAQGFRRSCSLRRQKASVYCQPSKSAPLLQPLPKRLPDW